MTTLQRIEAIMKESRELAFLPGLVGESMMRCYEHATVARDNEVRRRFSKPEPDVQPYVYPEPRTADGHYEECPLAGLNYIVQSNVAKYCTCAARKESAITAAMSGPISDPQIDRFASRWRNYGLEGNLGEEGYEHIRNVALRFYGLGKRDAEKCAARKE